MTTGWQTGPNDFPWPPANLQVVSPMFTGAFDLRWDDPSLLNTGPTSVQQAAGATVTVLGVPQVVTTSSGTITITTSPIPVGETITIDGIEITSIAGSRPAGSDQFNGLLGSPSLIAASVAEAINDGSIAGFGVATATVLGNIVTVTAVLPGASGDDIGLTVSTNDILTSGYHLSGGFDAATLTIGLAVLTATVEDRVSGELNFKVGPTSYDTAQSIAEAINDPENFVSYVSATSGGDVTNITATIVGSEGNGIVLRTTSSALVLSGSNLSGGMGGDCNGRSNTQWDIVGVNIYRSDNGERGPYIRVNRFPIGSLFYRDLTDNTFIENEVVRWDGSWLSKGDAPNSYRWTFRTVFFPVVKPNETPPIYQNARLVAIPANSPSDIILRVDGVVIPVSDVYGPTGEITLINQPTWDIAQEKVIPPVIPTETSAVTISYRYAANQVQSTLDRTTQSFYRVTTVALDSSKPSGYAETPLGYSPPVSVSQVETIDYIWREAVRRNLWILQQGGERVKLFKRKVSGIPCPCRIEERTLEYGKQPSNRCTTCLGSGFVGGFDGPIDIIVAPDDAERSIAQGPNGRNLEHTYEVWTGPSPAITQRDFVVKQTGERYSIGPVRRPSMRGLPLQQHFNIAYLDEQDIRYRMPVNGITELPWPQTRPTDPNTPCNPQPPHPVGFDYQATPMETENPNVPDGREVRGRTPVWGNTTY